MLSQMRFFIIPYFLSNATTSLRKGINSKFQPVEYLEITYDLLKTFSLCQYIKERFNRKFNLA